MLLLGCASTPEEPSEKAIALEEIKRGAIKELQRNCENDIFWGVQPKYPFVNFTSYRRWVSMGGRGPSPTQWCRAYAEGKVL